MKIYFLPKTSAGRWSIALIILWPLLTILGSVVMNALYPEVEAGNGIIDDLRVRPLLAATMLLGIASGLASLPASLIAIVKKSERSLFVFLSALLGLFLVMLLLGEIFVQH